MYGKFAQLATWAEVHRSVPFVHGSQATPARSVKVSYRTQETIWINTPKGYDLNAFLRWSQRRALAPMAAGQ